MPGVIQVQVNGKKVEVPEGLTLQNLLTMKDVNPNVVACEQNLKIIRRKDLPTTPVKSGDVIEIIQMIGGG